MNYKKLVLFCISFFAAFFGEIAVNIACGGGYEDPYDYFTSYFHNDLGSKDYQQFRFSELVHLYHEGQASDEIQVNAKEWASYLKIKPEEAQRLYGRDTVAIEKISRMLNRGKFSSADSLMSIPFFSALIKNKKASAYYLFAKSCEPFISANGDPWDPAVRDTVAMLQKANDAILAIKKVRRDQFLKLRYAYQAERLLHYAGHYLEAKQVYEKYILANKSATALNGWALSIYAGAVRKLGEPTKAAYLFSKVFASNPERRTQTYKDFFFTNAHVDSILLYTKDDLERTYVYAINGLGNAELDHDNLVKVYELDSQSPMLSVLLIREINKLERRLLSTSRWSYFDNYHASNAETQAAIKTHLQAIKQFAVKLGNDQQYPERVLGWLSAAYLSWMANSDKDAKTYLAKLNAGHLQGKYLDQYRIIELLIKTTQLQNGKALNAAEFLPLLRWLDQKRAAENQDISYLNDDHKFTKTARDVYQQILAPIYLKKGDTVTAALLMLKGDLPQPEKATGKVFQYMEYETLKFWQNKLRPEMLEKMVSLKRQSARKDGYQGMLARLISDIEQDRFNELLGTTYLRVHHYQKAVDCFNSISAGYQFAAPSDWYNQQDSYANPFQTTINDYPKNYKGSKEGLNKKEFARAMLSLEQKIKTDPKNAAVYYYQMANGVYQTGYYGNSWGFISYDWSSDAYADPADNYFDADFKLALTAKKWYLKARSLSKDADFKAKCTFMLAKCEQKEQTNKLFQTIGRYDGYEESRQISLNNPYFKELRQYYGKTSYFKKVLGSCNYLADFIAQAN